LYVKKALSKGFDIHRMGEGYKRKVVVNDFFLHYLTTCVNKKNEKVKTNDGRPASETEGGEKIFVENNVTRGKRERVKFFYK